MPTATNISPLVNTEDLISFRAVAGSSKLHVILSMIWKMENRGIRLQANKRAVSRVRIRIRKVLGILCKPPSGKKWGANRFCNTCSSRKKATVTVMMPVLILSTKDRWMVIGSAWDKKMQSGKEWLKATFSNQCRS